MSNTTGRILCGTAALLTAAAAGPAVAAVVDASPTQPASYAELLNPVPNAVALLKADDAAREAEPAPLQLAQYHHHHHHHHHHHNHWRRWGYYGPHCYWTWGAPFWNGFRWVPRHIRVCN